jgi:eukaryotic-like serine/threonine-protein kinase
MTSGGNDTTASAGFLMYENPTYGISMQYPSDWRISESNDHTTQIVEFDTPSAGSLIVTIVKLDKPNYNLKQFLDEKIQELNIYTDQVEESTTNAILANQPAYSLIYTDTTTWDKVKEVGTIIGDKVYILTYSTNIQNYSTYLEIVDKMIDSFQITNISNSTIEGIDLNPPS